MSPLTPYLRLKRMYVHLSGMVRGSLTLMLLWMMSVRASRKALAFGNIDQLTSILKEIKIVEEEEDSLFLPFRS